MLAKKSKRPKPSACRFVVLTTPGIHAATLAATAAINRMTPRQLATHHMEALKEILDSGVATTRDYDDETSPFSRPEADRIDTALARAAEHIAHIRAIVREGAGGAK